MAYHSAGWYAFMQSQMDKQKREEEWAQRQAEREQWKYEHMTGKTCPRCGENLLLRDGKNGRFIGCYNYPECRYIENENSLDKSSPKCPKCGKRLVKREGKYGPFMGCTGDVFTQLHHIFYTVIRCESFYYMQKVRYVNTWH